MSENLEKAKIHFQAGLEAIGNGNFVQAENELCLANELAPARPSILTNLSATLIHQHQWSKAIDLCHQLLEVEPGNLDALTNLGVCRLNTGDASGALAYFDQALKIDPSFAPAWVNKGNVLLEQELFDPALDCFNQALKLNPQSEEAFVGLGNLHNERKAYTQGIDCFTKALAINPHNVQAQWNKALSLLRMGDFIKGWELYESRWQIGGMREHQKQFHVPLWLGKESLENKTILIHAEQGYGDTIQFCRYIPLLESMGARVILVTPKSLTTLMKSLSQSVTVIEDSETALSLLPVQIDFYCPIMSLALAFKTTLDTIPNHTPYLFADEAKRKHWQANLESNRASAELEGKTLRVGIAWAGSGHYAGKKNGKRDIPPHEIASLINSLSNKAIEFHSLQIEKSRNDALSKLVTGNFKVHDQEIRDFSDTAALMTELDLIISIDSASAHLAGALNCPTILLIPDPPDFMALIERSDSPWYPSTKIIRQKLRGSWPIEKIVTEINKANN